MVMELYAIFWLTNHQNLALFCWNVVKLVLVYMFILKRKRKYTAAESVADVNWCVLIVFLSGNEEQCCVQNMDFVFSYSMRAIFTVSWLVQCINKYHFSVCLCSFWALPAVTGCGYFQLIWWLMQRKGSKQSRIVLKINWIPELFQ